MMALVRRYLGSTLFFLFLVIGIILFTLGILLIWPVTTLGHRREIARKWAGYNRLILRWTCGLTDHVQGREHLPNPPYLLFVKHQSTWETLTMHAMFPVFVLVLKKSLLHIPFFGWSLRATRQIAIDRDLGIQAMHLVHHRGLEEFHRGVSVLVFPEGTRVAPGQVGKYNAGGVLLAIEAGVPVVPVAHNGGTFWGRRSFMIHPGVIQIRIGPAIPTKGLEKKDRKKVLELARESVETMMDQIQNPLSQNHHHT
ncbi:MAG: 1-acyl-sn-glycerol-3-phosphate acyltransferase [Magnetococcales bacterium]|nr:1-acyl-sn-glycerol-3-phosphate acyltransferase [Magnetococcales bacterium]